MPEQTPAVINPYWGAINHAPTELNNTKKIINIWAALALFMTFLVFALNAASFMRIVAKRGFLLFGVAIVAVH